MSNKKIFKIATDNYIKCKAGIEKKLDVSKEIKYKFKRIENANYIELNDGVNIITAEYEFLGTYVNNIWTWAWNNPFVNRKLTVMSEKVKDYGKYIIENYETFNSDEVDQLYYFIKYGNFYSTADLVDLLLKIALWICKGEWYMGIDENREYIIITKIIQY